MRKVLAGEPAEDPFAAGGRRRTGRKRAPQLLTPLPPPSHTSGLCTGPASTGSAPRAARGPRARAPSSCLPSAVPEDRGILHVSVHALLIKQMMEARPV